MADGRRMQSLSSERRLVGRQDMIKLYAGLTALILIGGSAPAVAQTIGYAEAIGRLSISCGKDIQQFCKKANLGGGRVQQCLDQNQAKVSAACRAASAEVKVLLQKRADARRQVLKVCEIDMRRRCPDVQPGDGNILECILKAERSVSSQCNQAVTNAGYR